MTVETNPVFNLLSQYTVVTEEEKAIISELVFYKSFKKNEVFHLQGQLTKYFAIVGKGALRFFIPMLKAKSIL